jgi:hypothetical protein
MKAFKIFLIFILFSSFAFAQIKFDDYFYNKTLRIDYYHTGNFDTAYYSIDQLREEPYWGGTKTNLTNNYDYGHYKVEVFDSASGKEIYSTSYNTLFQEWRTTDESKQTAKTFSETVTMPYPKNNIVMEFFSRDKNNVFQKKFIYNINPHNYFISTERHDEFPSYKVLYNGNPSSKVDIVLIPDGYTKDQIDDFKNDCKKFVDDFFQYSPFKENKDKFNIWAVLAPSEESGSDIPTDHVWKRTLLNTSFYTFDEERYLMTKDNKTLRNVAANVPYDEIYILVNTDKYGGGAIFNFYSCSASKNVSSSKIYVHEFGHNFAGLADEYSEKGSPYQFMYNLKVEPIEPNITTLVDFSSKWKNMVKPSTPIPTPDNSDYKNIVGAFEGGGYLEKGIYRPMENCIMRSLSADKFCDVCDSTIQKFIDFYTK